ncbi:MAG: GNAT family N-acetyltransferase [Beijerinckiaceae bacterium]
MSQPQDARPIIEPFDPARHDREGFSCGVAQVDNFFRRTAGKLSKADNLRVFVMRAAAGPVIGFHALNAHAVSYEDLPPRFARTRAGHGTIPAAYISMIGVDRRYTGRGFGGDLLVDALRRIASASKDLGIAVVLLDILDDGDIANVARRKTLYTGYGFQPLASNPLRLFLPVATVRMLTEAAQQRDDSA